MTARPPAPAITGKTHRADAIVVGGGHNGLVAAFYLARAGLRVEVLERRMEVGGPAATVEFFPGYRGAMTNSPGSVEPRIVADMELERFGLTWLKPDPSVLQAFPGGRFFVGWRDQKRMHDHIARTFSRRDADAYPGIFEFFNDFARRIKVSLYEPPPSLAELAARLTTPEDEADFATIFFGSIRDFVEQRLETDEVRAAVSLLAGSGAFAPSSPGSPAVLLLRPMSLYSSSVDAVHDPRTQPLRGSTGLPVGGMGSIVAAMRRALEHLGVTIRTEATVARIIAGADHTVRGVALDDGTEFLAPIVLSNLHPRTTLLDLVEADHLPADIGRRLKALPSGGAVFKVVLGVDEPPFLAGASPEDAVAYSTCQFRIAPGMDYLERCHDDFHAKRLTDCPRLWGLMPSFASPEQAPPGRHLISVNAWFFPYELAPSQPSGGDWATAREVMGQRIVSILTEYIPSLKRSIVAQRFYSPVDIERDYGLVGGNFAQIDMTPDHMFALRPIAGLARYRTPIAGLYLGGAGTWPGGTVTGLPGYNSSHQILRDMAAGNGAGRRPAAAVGS